MTATRWRLGPSHRDYEPPRRYRPDGQWAMRHAACVECGTTEVSHRAHGYCRRCGENRENAIKRAQSGPDLGVRHVRVLRAVLIEGAVLGATGLPIGVVVGEHWEVSA